jgi:hypothetical protein
MQNNQSLDPADQQDLTQKAANDSAVQPDSESTDKRPRPSNDDQLERAAKRMQEDSMNFKQFAQI